MENTPPHKAIESIVCIEVFSMDSIFNIEKQYRISCKDEIYLHECLLLCDECWLMYIHGWYDVLNLMDFIS